MPAQPLRKPVVILAGFSNEIIQLAEQKLIKISAVVDENINAKSCNGLQIFDDDELAISIIKPNGVLNAIDHIPNKVRVDGLYSRSGIEPVDLIAGVICSSSNYENGLIMQMGSVVSSNCKLGRCVKLNTSSTVTHDVSIGNYSIIAPGAVVLGRVKIGERVYIGANATILPDITIGDRAVIGAGCVVTKDVSPRAVMAGIPGKELKKKL